MEKLPYEIALERQLARRLEKELKRLKASVEGVHAAKLSPTGAEILDPKPLVKAIKGNRLEDFEAVRRYIREQISPAAAEAGQETFEEFMDMDVPDDTGLEGTPYEQDADNLDDFHQTRQKRQSRSRTKKALAAFEEAQRPKPDSAESVAQRMDDRRGGGDSGTDRGQTK